MVARVGSIEILFDVNYGRASAHARRFGDQIERTGNRAERATRDVDRGVMGMNRSIRSMRAGNFQTLGLSAVRASNSIDRLRTGLLAVTTLAGGLGTAFTLKGIQEYSDTWTTIESRLRVVKRESETLAGIQGTLFDVAQRSRAQYESTAILFARIEQSSKRLNISQKDTLRATETIQKAFLVGGSTPIESAQSAIQLSQGIASNRLQGDELRSVLENPALGRLLADEITDGDIGALRDLASEGELTAKTIVNAFVNASDAIDELFAQTEVTFGQALIRLDNEIMKAVGRNGAVDEGMRVSISAVNALADNMEGIVDALQLVAVTAIAAFGGRSLRAVGRYATEVRSATQATVAQAAEERKAAQARLVDAQQARAAARESAARQAAQLQTMRADGNYTDKQITRQIAHVTKAEGRLVTAINDKREASRKAVVATNKLNAAQKSARLGTIAWTGSMKALGGAMGFLGGPLGVALIGVGLAMAAQARHAAAAEARADRYAEAIRRAGEANDDAAPSIRETSRALKEQEQILSIAEAVKGREQANKDLTASFEDLRSALGKYISVVNRGLGYGAAAQVSQVLASLVDSFEETNASAEDFLDAVNRLERSNPDFSPFLIPVRELVQQIAAARGELDAFNATIRNLQMPEVNLSAPSGGRLGAPTLNEMREQMGAKIGAGDWAQLGEDQKKALEEFVKKQQEAAAKDPFLARLYGVPYKPTGSKGQSDTERVAERLQKKLDDLRFEQAIDGLSRLDQETLKAARSIGLGQDKLEQFMAFARGQGGEAPAEIVAIRQEMDKVAAIKFQKGLRGLEDKAALALMDDLDRKTIEAARSFGVAETQVDAFMAALRSGGDIPPQMAQIRTELEAIANNEKLARIGDDLAGGIGEFFSDFVSGAENAGDALVNLLSRVAELIFELTVLEPLSRSIRGALGGGGGLLGSLLNVSGGGSPGVQAAIDAGIAGPFHEGGTVGGGRRHKEVLALVEQGETFFNENQTDRIGNALSQNVGAGVERIDQNVTYAPVYNFSGTQAEFDEFRRQVATDRAQFDQRVIGTIRNPKYSRHIRS